jgi:CheY-like chemotaxis protein
VRVLIVDDEPLARRGVVLRLRKFKDVEIVGECGDGQSAVENILERSPDVVFLDIQMPGMDGFEVLRALPIENLPAIIFLTAYEQHPAPVHSQLDPGSACPKIHTHQRGSDRAFCKDTARHQSISRSCRSHTHERALRHQILLDYSLPPGSTLSRINLPQARQVSDSILVGRRHIRRLMRNLRHCCQQSCIIPVPPAVR